MKRFMFDDKNELLQQNYPRSMSENVNLWSGLIIVNFSYKSSNKLEENFLAILPIWIFDCSFHM